MRALITGAAGFIGRHMAAELRARGWDAVGFDIKPTYGEPGQRVFYGDVRNIGTADGATALGQIRASKFDLIVHCAYRVGGRATIDGAPMALAHNVAADAALFEWALTTGQRRVLYFSSSAAYPVTYQNSDWHGYRLEEDDIGLTEAEEPDANYGWAKLTGERLARAAAAEGLAVHVVRPFSGYGSDQADDYPFPALLRRVMRGDDPIEVWGSADQVRDWIHIDDVVNGALAVVDADVREPVNLCTGRATTVGDLVAMMWQAAGRPPVPQLQVLTDKPMGVFWRVGSPDRMRQHYMPAVTLEEGIRRAVADHPEWRNG